MNKPCPWESCSWHSKGSEPRIDYSFSDGYVTGDLTWIVCGDQDCEADGPIARSKAEAWERWNELPRSARES